MWEGGQSLFLCRGLATVLHSGTLSRVCTHVDARARVCVCCMKLGQDLLFLKLVLCHSPPSPALMTVKSPLADFKGTFSEEPKVRK